MEALVERQGAGPSLLDRGYSCLNLNLVGGGIGTLPDRVPGRVGCPSSEAPAAALSLGCARWPGPAHLLRPGRELRPRAERRCRDRRDRRVEHCTPESCAPPVHPSFFKQSMLRESEP